MSFLKSFTAPNMPAILTAGTKEKHNSLIIVWALLGAAWQRPLFLVYVHPDRYTFEFMKTTEFFTVSFIKKNYIKISFHLVINQEEILIRMKFLELIFNF